METIGGYSAHADRSELRAWVRRLGGPIRRAFVVHGEIPASVPWPRSSGKRVCAKCTSRSTARASTSSGCATSVRLSCFVLLAGAIVYTVGLVAVLVASQQDQRRPVDAIVVLGAAQYNGRPSPVLRARLDHALGLYRDGFAPLIVVTGGVGRGDTTSEAIVGRRYLMAHDVPAEPSWRSRKGAPPWPR